MTAASDRTGQVAAVLEAVTVLSRAITAGRRVPFQGRALTGTQMQALYLLAHGRRPVTPARLAAALGVTAGAVTQLVDGLRAEHLVETAPNPDDARSGIIRLTPAAKADVGVFERRTAERLLPLFDALSDDDLQALASILQRVTQAP